MIGNCSKLLNYELFFPQLQMYLLVHILISEPRFQLYFWETLFSAVHYSIQESTDIYLSSCGKRFFNYFFNFQWICLAEYRKWPNQYKVWRDKEQTCDAVIYATKYKIKIQQKYLLHLYTLWNRRWEHISFLVGLF